MRLFAFFLSFLFSISVLAALEIPQGLNSTERKKALEILGFASASKILGNPYPLGGYSGVEIGYTTEVIQTAELSSLGNKPQGQSETAFSVLTLGKGIYNNIDLFVQFSPFTQAEAISNFGGQFRWGFYQSEFLPAHLSVVFYADSTNFQNKITTVSQGTDLVASLTLQDVTAYTGIGFVRAIGTFIGGASAVTDSGDTAQEDVSQSHYLAGLNIKFSKMFLAVEIDRYSQATYAAKLGLRF